MLALLGVAMLPHVVAGLDQPKPTGYLLMIVAVLATFTGMFVDSVLSGDADGIERYALEVCLAAAGALLSIAIVQTAGALDDMKFAAAILVDAGLPRLTPARATWLLALFSTLLVAIAFAIAAVLRKHKLGHVATLLRLVSLSGLLVGYSLFLLTVMYSG
jgi:hypothetical protein